MDKMILKDNTEIELQAGGSLSAVAVKFDSEDDMLQAWKKMTPENLAEVKFQNDAGTTIGEYADLILISETSQETSDCIFFSRENRYRKAFGCPGRGTGGAG